MNRLAGALVLVLLSGCVVNAGHMKTSRYVPSAVVGSVKLHPSKGCDSQYYEWIFQPAPGITISAHERALNQLFVDVTLEAGTEIAFDRPFRLRGDGWSREFPTLRMAAKGFCCTDVPATGKYAGPAPEPHVVPKMRDRPTTLSVPGKGDLQSRQPSVFELDLPSGRTGSGPFAASTVTFRRTPVEFWGYCEIPLK